MKKKMINRRRVPLFIMVATTLILFFTACSSDNAYDEPSPKLVQLKNNATLGSYLADKDGRTLYYFANDSATVNTCSGGCALAWPVFNASGLNASTIGDGLEPADFGEITTAASVKQTTYKGRPLYYYAPKVNDVNTLEAPGETKGEAVGGVWFVAKPDYTIMITRAQLVGDDGKNYVFTTGNPSLPYTEGNGKSAYFTDGKGMTLYIFTSDSMNINKFTRPDFSNNPAWPIYDTTQIVVPSVLDKMLFGVIDVYGHKQLTYKGWPLYYYGADNMQMGSTKGITIPHILPPGAKWPVATKDLQPAPHL